MLRRMFWRHPGRREYEREYEREETRAEPASRERVTEREVRTDQAREAGGTREATAYPDAPARTYPEAPYRERVSDRERTTEREVRHEARPEVYVEEQVRRVAFTPAQIYALGIGIVYTFLGAFALARAGLGDVSTHVSAVGLHHTQRLALIELAFGLLMILSSAVPRLGRFFMILLGAGALGLGIVVATDTGGTGVLGLHSMLGTHEIHAWLYIITGVVTLIFGFAAPIFWWRQKYLRRVR
ncbi:MAG: hypothetical protein HY682_05905 [Chloroflexi bacterium]|nr:hypothetical protein [Chloroflexota bacterium]